MAPSFSLSIQARLPVASSSPSLAFGQFAILMESQKRFCDDQCIVRGPVSSGNGMRSVLEYDNQLRAFIHAHGFGI